MRGFFVNNVMIPVSELSAIAQFSVSRDDIAFFESGIAKVRLTTVPIVHEKSFSYDVIGGYLHKELLKASISKDDF